MRGPIHFGLIGSRFMGKAHSHALHDLGFFFEPGAEAVRHVLCGLEDDLDATAARYGWKSTSRSWRDVVADQAVDAISIAAPGNLHCEIAVAAAEAGKHVLCEKPLALNGAEAARMLAAAERAGVRHMVNFNYRRLPAVNLAKRLIAEGRLGDIYYFRATYWQDWPLDPQFPHVWRFDKKIAGAGSLADKGSHIVDLARFLVGEISEVAAAATTYIKERDAKPVTTDDAAAFIGRFANGALGLFGTSRMSAGHKNALGFEVNGSRGSLIFDLERLNELQVYFAGEDPAAEGFRTVMVTQAEHEYIKSWWPPGHIIGWEHTFVHQYYEFVKAIAGNTPASPDFRDGLAAQQVLDAVEAAVAEKRWVTVCSEQTT